MRFEAAETLREEAMHRCTTCGRTEIQAPGPGSFAWRKTATSTGVEHLPKAPRLRPRVRHSLLLRGRVFTRAFRFHDGQLARSGWRRADLFDRIG